MKKILILFGIILLCNITFAQTIEEEIKEIVGRPICGDDICEGEETSFNCEKDCGKFDIVKIWGSEWASRYMIYALVGLLIYKTWKNRKKNE